jgi:cytochrome P450
MRVYAKCIAGRDKINRKLLAGKFTVRRMAQLTERIERVAAQHLDAMERHGGPIDLVPSFAQPIPAMVICELLGVPYDDREHFQADAAKLFGVNTTPEGQYEAFGALSANVRELVTAKRAEPADDVLSDLTASDLTDDELAGMGGLLFAAGLDTTANMIALGTFALLQHPDQWAALCADPDLVDPAVEELMRYLSSPSPSSSRMRRRTGSPSTSNACTRRRYQRKLI